MAALYDGIERKLADMRWSTESAYQIKATFYVISQPSTGTLPIKLSLNRMMLASQPISIKMARPITAT